MRGHQRRGRVGARIHSALEHGLDQVRALREVPVQRPDPDLGQIGDLLRGRVYAGRGEDGLCFSGKTFRIVPEGRSA
jgi:hypothetical protein